MDKIRMKARKTFYHKNGYVFAGQEFDVYDQADADNYAFMKVASFVDESQNVNGINANAVGDLKKIPTLPDTPEKDYFSISDMERNVTSVNKPIEIKLTITGVDPEQVKVSGENVEQPSQEKQAQSQTNEVPFEQSQNEQQSFEVKHLGGGWYQLPNGEKVQGKANVEPRMMELFNNGELSGGSVQVEDQQSGNGFTPNQERVEQANVEGVSQSSNNQGGATGGYYSGNSGSVGGNVGNQAGVSASGVQEGNDRGQNAQFQARNEDGQFAEQGRVQNANTQPRNSEGEFQSSGQQGAPSAQNQPAGMSGSVGEAGGAGTAGRTGGTAGTSGSGGSTGNTNQ